MNVQSRTTARTIAIIIFTAVAIVGAVVVWWLHGLDRKVANRSISDAGIVQVASIVLLGLAILILPIRSELRQIRLRLPLLILLLLYIAREMDWHNRFTHEPVTRIKYFFENDDALSVRLIAAAILIGAVSAAVWSIRRFAPYWVDGLRRHRPWALLGIGWMVFLITAQIIDKLTSTDGNGDMYEESLELCASILVCVIAVMLPRRLPEPGGAETPTGPGIA